MTITIDNYVEPAGAADQRETPAASNSDSAQGAEATAADAELGVASPITSDAQNGYALTGARADLQQSRGGEGILCQSPASHWDPAVAHGEFRYEHQCTARLIRASSHTRRCRPAVPGRD
jgi:hypothetical protein